MFVEIHKQQAVSLSQLRDFLDIYRGEKKGIKYSLTEEGVRIVKVFANSINFERFSVEEILRAIEETKRLTKAEGKQLFLPIRLAATKQEHGPELASAIFLFGKERIEKRLTPYIKRN